MKENTMITKEEKGLEFMEFMNYTSGNYKNIIRKAPTDFDTKQNSIWIFHHTDLDGYCSGHLVERYLSSLQELKDVPVNLVPTDYNSNFENFEIYENDLIWLVDLSMTEDKLRYLYTQSKNVYWIDHHASNVKMLKADESIENLVNKFNICVLGDTSNKYSAAMLVYCTLFETIPDKAPLYVKLTSDWDTWTHDYPNSICFNEAMNGLPNYKLIDRDGNIDQDSIWMSLWKEKDSNDLAVLDKVINRGRPIVEDTERKNARYLGSNGFEFELLDYKILCCNMKSNSLLFGSKIDDYDMVCPFVMQERDGKLVWTYSLFSNKDYVDCSDVAKLFGGGGHKGAAGFTVPYCIFTEPMKLKLTLNKKKKEIKKIYEKQYE